MRIASWFFLKENFFKIGLFITIAIGLLNFVNKIVKGEDLNYAKIILDPILQNDKNIIYYLDTMSTTLDLNWLLIVILWIFIFVCLVEVIWSIYFFIKIILFFVPTTALPMSSTVGLWVISAGVLGCLIWAYNILAYQTAYMPFSGILALFLYIIPHASNIFAL